MFSLASATGHVVRGRSARSQPRRMHRRTTCELAVLFAPVVFVVAVGRLIERTYVANIGLDNAMDPVTSDLPAVLFLSAVVAAGFVVAHAQLRMRHPVIVGVAGLGLTVGVFALGGLLLPWWITGWVSIPALSYVQGDLLWVLVAYVGSATILTYTRGVGRQIARFAVVVVALTWVLFYLAESGVLIATGLTGSYFMLQDAMTRPSEVLPLLASELEWGHLIVVGIPIAVILSAPHVAHRFVREETEAYTAPAYYGVGRAVWISLPFALLFAFAPSRFELPSESSVGRFVRTAFHEVDDQELSLRMGEAEGFDTRDLYVTGGSAPNKNVVVIVMESVRSRSTSLYNPGLDTTPFLDSLARHSLVVEEFFVPVSYTNKSLVSLFGGIYPSPEGFVLEGEAVPGGIPARGLPSLLADEGYRSAFFTPAVMAFERKDVILANLGFSDVYGDSSFDKEGFTQKAYFGYEDRVALDATLDWAEGARSGGDPFLLGFLTLTSHHPYDTPPSFETRAYDTGDETLDAYLNAIRYTDRFVQDLMAGFDKRGLLDETVFIIVGDHGEAFGEHTARLHGDVLWDEALQVPALIYAPGVVAPGRATGTRHSIDIVPTVLDVLGLETEGAVLPGASLLEPAPTGRTLFHACRNARAGLAVRQDSLKFLYWMRRPTQVFNTVRDPEERFDLAATLPRERMRRVESEARTWYYYNEQAYTKARLDAEHKALDLRVWREENEELFERTRY